MHGACGLPGSNHWSLSLVRSVAQWLTQPSPKAETKSRTREMVAIPGKLRLLPSGCVVSTCCLAPLPVGQLLECQWLFPDWRQVQVQGSCQREWECHDVTAGGGWWQWSVSVLPVVAH